MFKVALNKYIYTQASNFVPFRVNYFPYKIFQEIGLT